MSDRLPAWHLLDEKTQRIAASVLVDHVSKALWHAENNLKHARPDLARRHLRKCAALIAAVEQLGWHCDDLRGRVLAAWARC